MTTTCGYAPVLHTGWYFAAMVDELVEEVTSLRVGPRRLMVVREAGGTPRVYDAVCPHRGADLSVGGCLTRGGVVCPFHGKAVHLGRRESARYWVGELPTVCAGGALFVALDATALQDNGFGERLKAVADTHRLTACPPVHLRVGHELVTENAFDLDHFVEVHKIPRVRTTGAGRTAEGAAWCSAEFTYGVPAWAGAAGSDRLVHNRFHATAYSPSVVVTELGDGATGQVVVTTAVPQADDPAASRIRVLVGLRPGSDPAADALAVTALVEGAGKAMRQDAPVWENLTPDLVPQFDPRDGAVLLFRDFCATFADLGDRR